MKKLFIGMGTMVSAIAPVAAVVACGDKDESATTMSNGQFVDHAFRDHATYANIKGETKSDLFDDASETKWDALIAALGTAPSSIRLSDLITAVNTFNAAKASIKADATPSANVDVINALKGKTIKAELFFQQDSRGGMTFVNAAPFTWKEGNATHTVSDHVFPVDRVQHGHRALVGTMSLRIVAA